MRASPNILQNKGSDKDRLFLGALEILRLRREGRPFAPREGEGFTTKAGNEESVANYVDKVAFVMPLLSRTENGKETEAAAAIDEKSSLEAA
jgi:hypothetical protein